MAINYVIIAEVQEKWDRSEGTNICANCEETGFVIANKETESEIEKEN